MSYKLVKDLFPIGTILEEEQQLREHKQFGTLENPLFTVMVGLGKDHTATLLLDLDTLKNNPEYFELEEGIDIDPTDTNNEE